MIAPGRETRPTMPARPRNENSWLQNRERIQILLRQTERALLKLENGTYGYCEDTGEPIDLKRLMAQPATSLSLAAQQAREGRTG